MNESIRLWEFLGQEGESDIQVRLENLKEAAEKISRARNENGSFERARELDEGARTNPAGPTQALYDVEDFLRDVIFLAIEYAFGDVVAGLRDEMPAIDPEDAKALIEHMTYADDNAEEDLLDIMKRFATALLLPQENAPDSTGT